MAESKYRWVPWVAGGVAVAGVAWWWGRRGANMGAPLIDQTVDAPADAPPPFALGATVTNKRAGATDMRVGDSIVVAAVPSGTVPASLEFRVVITRPGGASSTPCNWSSLKTCSFPLDVVGVWSAHVEARVAGTLDPAAVSSETPFTVSAANGSVADIAASVPQGGFAFVPPPAGSFAIMDGIEGVIAQESSARAPDATPVDLSQTYVYRPQAPRTSIFGGGIGALIPPFAPQSNPGSAVPAGR